MRFYVTGCGRSGTGYMSHVLSAAGARCGHEQVFTPLGPNLAQAQAWDADSSWMAVPYMESLGDYPGIQIFRHPAAVVASLVGIDFFTHPSHTIYRDFLYRHIDGLDIVAETEGPIAAACRYYVWWNDAALKHATLVTEISDLAWEHIATLADISQIDLALAIDQTSETINHRQRANISPRDLSTAALDMYEELKGRAP